MFGFKVFRIDRILALLHLRHPEEAVAQGQDRMPVRIDHARILNEEIRQQKKNQNHDDARPRIEVRQN